MMLYFILEISPALNNLQQTLKVMTVQKGLINTNITAIRDDLRGIQRGQHLPTHCTWLLLSTISDIYTSLFVCALDDINDMISNAKSMIRNANDITDEVLDGLSPIEIDVARIKDTYGSTQSEDFNKALTDADNSGIRHSSARTYYPFFPLLCALVNLCKFFPDKV